MTENRDNWGGNGASSSTRGLFIGGNPGSNFSNTIDFITISSTGDTTNFGDTITAVRSTTWEFQMLLVVYILVVKHQLTKT